VAEDSTSVACILTGLTAARHAIASAWPFTQAAPPPPNSLLPENRLETPRWNPLGRVSPAELHAEVKKRVVVLTLAHVPAAWDNAWKTALVHADAGHTAPDRHAVLAVGEAERGGHQALHFRNSWGGRWGESGYGYVTDTYLNHYLISAVSFECDQTDAAA